MEMMEMFSQAQKRGKFDFWDRIKMARFLAIIHGEIYDMDFSSNQISMLEELQQAMGKNDMDTAEKLIMELTVS